MQLIQPVHSYASRGFWTRSFGYHRVFHIASQCFYLGWIVRNGHLALGKGGNNDLCINCYRLLV